MSQYWPDVGEVVYFIRFGSIQHLNGLGKVVSVEDGRVDIDCAHGRLRRFVANIRPATAVQKELYELSTLEI